MNSASWLRYSAPEIEPSPMSAALPSPAITMMLGYGPGWRPLRIIASYPAATPEVNEAALAHPPLVPRGQAGGERAAAGDRRVRPRDRVRGAQVRRVRHVHAAGRASDDRVLAGRLEHPPVLDGRPASRAGPVPGLVGVFVGHVGQIVPVPPGVVLRGRAAAFLLQQREVLPGDFDGHQRAPRAM